MKLSILSSVAVLAVAASCGKKEGGTAASPAVKPGDSRYDYSKPYLTEANVEKLLVALKDGDNPLKSALGAAGMVRGPGSRKEDLAQLDATARKYGFEGFEDYMAVWGRVTVAQLQVWGEQVSKSSNELFTKNIASAEEALKKPDLSPEMREMYEEQVKSGREALESTKTEAKSELNAADLAVFKKYQTQIEAATKKAAPPPAATGAAKEAEEPVEEAAPEEEPSE
jgi:hypothetical protein